jgi:hypothetical protein
MLIVHCFDSCRVCPDSVRKSKEAESLYQRRYRGRKLKENFRLVVTFMLKAADSNSSVSALFPGGLNSPRKYTCSGGKRQLADIVRDNFIRSLLHQTITAV